MNAFNHYLKILFIAGIFISCDKDKDSSQQEKPNTNRRNPDSISRVETDIREDNVFKCDYMKQEKPDSMPVKFMPGFISTRVDESCFETSPSGKEIVFNREYDIYLIHQDEKGIWTQPVLFLNSSGENSFSKDGSKIYFNSRTAVPGAKVPLNVWAAEKKDNQWGKPFYLGGTVINQTVHAPTVSANGNIYASGIIRLKFLDNAYQEPEKLTPDINGTHPFIAANENFIIFDKRPLGGGQGADLFIAFRKLDSTWTEPVSLGEEINTTKLETNAYVTPDEKYMFFTRQFDIYWVKADFIEKIRKQVL